MFSLSPQADLNAKSFAGETPLLKAVKALNYRCVVALARKYEHLKLSTTDVDQTNILTAASGDDFKSICCLLLVNLIGEEKFCVEHFMHLSWLKVNREEMRSRHLVKKIGFQSGARTSD